jgi:GNAT superfamily N-acetyltransferase
VRDELLEFELALDLEVSDEIVAYDWGRAFLCPSLPLVWDLNWILIEREGMGVEEVIVAADEALADFQHRTVAIRSEADGARLAKEFEGVPGWEVENTVYMAWRGETGREAKSEVREARLADCEDLRRELIRSRLPDEVTEPEATAEQLLEMDRRFSAAAAGRWFLAPSQEPASACCLFSQSGIGQVEAVVTLPSAGGRGLAQAAVLAAVEASREAGHRVTFLGADADDWPRLMYEKLGFETCGTMHVLRRAFHQG